MNEIIQQIERLLQEYATIRALATSIGWAFVIYVSDLSFAPGTEAYAFTFG